MSSALYGSFALQHLEYGNVVEICNGIMFNFWLVHGTKCAVLTYSTNVCGQVTISRLSTAGTSSVTMEVNVLCEELSAVSDWYRLGLKLGVPDYRLDEIQRNHSSSRWKIEMLKMWRQLNPNASWMNVVRALQRIEELSLAKMIRRKYMRRGSSKWLLSLQYWIYALSWTLNLS